MTKRVRRMRKWINALRRKPSRGWRAWVRALNALRLSDLLALNVAMPDEWDWMQDFDRAVSCRLLFPYVGFELHRRTP